MGSFDREKFYSGFNYKKFELEKIQAAETRALINKNGAADILDSSSFYDQRIDLKKRQFKDLIELAIYSLVGSIPFKSGIDEEDGKAFNEIVIDISKGFLDHESDILKTSMVSRGNTIDSAKVTETLKAFEKQLNTVRSNTLELLPVKINEHNKIMPGSGGEVEKGQKWKKYSALIIIGIIVIIICAVVLYLIL
jgi:hypothetical protein